MQDSISDFSCYIGLQDTSYHEQILLSAEVC